MKKKYIFVYGLPALFLGSIGLIIIFSVTPATLDMTSTPRFFVIDRTQEWAGLTYYVFGGAIMLLLLGIVMTASSWFLLKIGLRKSRSEPKIIVS
jgi:hypothetical protein